MARPPDCQERRRTRCRKTSGAPTIHGDDVPALDTLGLTTDRDLLLLDATTMILQLAAYGVDALGIELVLAALYDAHDLDAA